MQKQLLQSQTICLKILHNVICCQYYRILFLRSFPIVYAIWTWCWLSRLTEIRVFHTAVSVCMREQAWPCSYWRACGLTQRNEFMGTM